MSLHLKRGRAGPVPCAAPRGATSSTPHLRSGNGTLRQLGALFSLNHVAVHRHLRSGHHLVAVETRRSEPALGPASASGNFETDKNLTAEKRAEAILGPSCPTCAAPDRVRLEDIWLRLDREGNSSRFAERCAGRFTVSLQETLKHFWGHQG